MTSVMFQTELSHSEAPQSITGGIKSVLLHIQDDKGLEDRLQAALAIARASGGHLTCLHVTPFTPYSGYEGFGGAYVMSGLIKEIDEHEAAMRARIEARLEQEDVAWSYQQLTSDPGAALTQAGALADLIVVGRFNHNLGSTRQTMSLYGDLLGSSRTPLLICAKGQTGFDPFGPAVIAWNASFEAANALRAALPLLQQASAVHVVTAIEQKDRDLPPLDAVEYLSRHGIHAEVIEGSPENANIAEWLVETAKGLGASYLVLGAYSHSRAREYLFGGVTRSLLDECPLALVAAR